MSAIQKLVYAIVACVIGYVIYHYIIPNVVFTNLTKLKEPNNKLQINKTSAKESIPITKGACSLDKSKQVISTHDYTQSMYVDLKPSQNRIGGTQFSYSFWLRKAPGSDLKNKIIFFRGNEIKSDKKKGFLYESAKHTTAVDTMRDDDMQFQNLDDSNTNNRFVKCPLVRFGEDSNSLKIEFNTLRNPHMSIDLDAEVFSHVTSSKKNPAYSLITIAFQDNFDFGGIERGIKVDTFLNKSLVKTVTFENNALRLNKGPLIMFPNNSTEETFIDADIVNLTYYNHAVDMNDVFNVYDSGFKEDICRFPDSWNKNTKSAHEYQELGLYNELQQI